MSAVYYGSAIKCVSTKKVIKSFFLTFTRNKDSRYLGYYKRKLSPLDFDYRKLKYRQEVLKPIEDMPNLQEKLKELNAVDPLLNPKVDIGLPSTSYKSKVTIKDRLEWRKLLADRKSQINVDGSYFRLNLDKVYADWKASLGPYHLQSIAEHYGIFSHLYDHGYFVPWVDLNVSYNFDEESVNPVYMGNILQANEVGNVPNVSFKSNLEDLWSLVLTNLDGHLLDSNSEYLHWFVGNIKGADIASGETVCDYLRPFPMRGTGYHRLVFVLYKQDKEIDFSKIKKKAPCLSLKERTFKTFDFYENFQDLLTPAGMAFYQCTWDACLTDFFHNILDMKEPVYEYKEPDMYYRPQEQYPHKRPFNLYLDRYRDPKEIKKEVLLKRLKFVEPFKEEPPMPKYPCLHKSENDKYSWLREDIRKERLRLGKYRDLRPHSVYPQEDDQFTPWNKT